MSETEAIRYIARQLNMTEKQVMENLQKSQFETVRLSVREEKWDIKSLHIRTEMAQQPAASAGVSSIWMLERGARSSASMDAMGHSIIKCGTKSNPVFKLPLFLVIRSLYQLVYSRCLYKGLV